MVAREGASWSLFVDWCEAVGQRPGDADAGAVDRFFEQVPCATSTRAERERLLRHRLGLPGPVPQPALSASELVVALPRIPWHGWSDGFRGRRDAWLLVLLATVPGPRSSLLSISPDLVGFDDGAWFVAGRRVERVDDPRACPGCAVARWLEVVATGSHWGRGSVRELLCAPPELGHVCGEMVPGRWREAWTLAPAIDRHGWCAWWRPLSVRAVRTIATRRGSAEDVFDPRRQVEVQPAMAGPHRDEAEVFADLDVVVARAAEVNRRVEAALGGG